MNSVVANTILTDNTDHSVEACYGDIQFKKRPENAPSGIRLFGWAAHSGHPGWTGTGRAVETSRQNDPLTLYHAEFRSTQTTGRWISLICRFTIDTTVRRRILMRRASPT
jgi:hypothetical protein